MKRLTIAAALAVLFTGAAYAETTELVLYKGANFHGPAQTIKGEVANLENGFGHEASSMVARGGAWQVCTGDHFSGRCRVIREGEYPTLGWLDDRIVSVKFLGDEQNLARYDNWEAKRQARDYRQDNRDWRDRRDEAARARDEAARYEEQDTRRGYTDRANDDRYWSRLPR